MAGVLARRCERAARQLLSEARAIAASTSTGAEHGRRPGIQFPPRRTATGERISDLPPEQAKAASAPAGPAAAPAASAPKPAAPSVPGFNAQLNKGAPPPRRTLTEAEMESINLGGAS
jgi:hypothetical protein